MKKVYIAIGLLLICISLCIFEQYTVNSTYKTAAKYIDTAIEYVDNENYEDAQLACEKLSDYWEKKYIVLKALIDHSILDEASITIASLKEMDKEDKEDIKNELISSKNQIKIMKENQQINLGNIF